MFPNDDFALIAALDLNPIKTKLSHVESGEGWLLERVEAAETEYRRFLYLLKAFPKVEMAPLKDVDTFWHCHILDTMKYARDCQQIFGYFLHHYPYLGMEGENGLELQQQATERIRELYQATFKVPYAGAADLPAAWCTGTDVAKAGDTQTAWCVVPGIAKAGDTQTAWCTGTGPGITKAGDAQAAWCVSPGDVKAA